MLTGYYRGMDTLILLPKFLYDCVFKKVSFQAISFWWLARSDRQTDRKKTFYYIQTNDNVCIIKLSFVTKHNMKLICHQKVWPKKGI